MLFQSSNKNNEYFKQVYRLASLGAKIKISNKRLIYNEKEIENLVNIVKEKGGELTISFNGRCSWLPEFLMRITEIGGDNIIFDFTEYFC